MERAALDLSIAFYGPHFTAFCAPGAAIGVCRRLVRFCARRRPRRAAPGAIFKGNRCFGTPNSQILPRWDIFPRPALEQCSFSGRKNLFFIFFDRHFLRHQSEGIPHLFCMFPRVGRGARRAQYLQTQKSSILEHRINPNQPCVAPASRRDSYTKLTV